MIRRFQRLEVEDFRAYGGTHDPIDLDGNVVLIHGRNGSGKTSLLAAIEYAVTGEVEHLSRFESDYPSVLSHRGGNGPGKVRLWAETVSGEAAFVERTVVERSPTNGAPFSSRARFAFKERSYLSQTHLSQLLRIYQSSSRTTKRGPKADTPVVRFIRDFLDLDHLESVEKGLYVAANKTRPPKEFPQYAELQSRIERSTSEASQTRARAESARAEEADARARLLDLLQRVGIAVDADSLDLSAIEREADRAASEARGQAERFTARARTLARAVAAGDEPPPVAPYDWKLGRDSLQRLSQSHAEGLAILGEPNPAPDYVPPETPSEDPSRAFSVMQKEAEAWAKRLNDSSEVLLDATRSVRSKRDRAVSESEELALLRKRTTEIQVQLDGLSSLNSTAVEDVQRRQALLTEALAQADGDTCPVCDRDYGELDKRLGDHIAEELEALGARTAELREQLDLQRALVAERGRLESRAAELESEAPSERAAAFEQRAKELARATRHFDAARKALSELDAPLAESQSLARSHAVRVEWLHTHREAATAAREALAELEGGSGNPSGSPVERAALAVVQKRASERADELLARVAGLNQVPQQARSVQRLTRQASEAEDLASKAAARLEELRATEERVQALIDEANVLRKAAARTTQRLVRRTFGEQLNDLVDDLYTRLVRDERFRPRITSQGKVGNLTAAVNAFARGEEDPAAHDIASLVSTANLNTAALSLFLALHLAEPSRPQTLVLDDPVQSMDDVHVTNLAALFRSLAYHPTSPRQLILAIHDKALFDYLTLELGPTKQGDSLVRVEITRESPEHVTARSTSCRWEPDEVRFGVAS